MFPTALLPLLPLLPYCPTALLPLLVWPTSPVSGLCSAWCGNRGVAWVWFAFPSSKRTLTRHYTRGPVPLPLASCSTTQQHPPPLTKNNKEYKTQQHASHTTLIVELDGRHGRHDAFTGRDLPRRAGKARAAQRQVTWGCTTPSCAVYVFKYINPVK